MIVAFIGNDGTGKTTLSKTLYDFLGELGFSREYREEFSYFILSYMFKLLGRRVGNLRKCFLGKRGDSRKVRYIFKIWPYIVLLDQLLLLIYLRIFKRGKIVILDRYIYDFLMSWEWLGYSSKLIHFLYERFPRADVVILCDASPSVCYERKRKTHEYNLRYYEVQRDRYIALARRLQIHIVSTEIPLIESINQVLLIMRSEIIRGLGDEEKVLLILSSPFFDPSKHGPMLSDINWKGLDWSYLLDESSKNGVEFLLMRNLITYYREELPNAVIELLEKGINICLDVKARISKTLHVLVRSLGNTGFIAFKTFMDEFNIPTDLDILVKEEDFERISSIISKLTSKEKVHKLHTAKTFISDELVPIDLHYEISWLGKKPLDPHDVWERCEPRRVCGIEILLPSHSDEVLIVSAHSAYQHHYVTLGELFHILWSLRNANLVVNVEDELVGRVIRYSIAKGLLIYGEDLRGRVKYSCKLSPLDVRSLSSTVYFLPISSVPKDTLPRLLDFILTIYRRVRYRFFRKLPYNENWLGILLKRTGS